MQTDSRTFWPPSFGIWNKSVFVMNICWRPCSKGSGNSTLSFRASRISSLNVRPPFCARFLKPGSMFVSRIPISGRLRILHQALPPCGATAPHRTQIQQGISGIHARLFARSTGQKARLDYVPLATRDAPSTPPSHA